MRLWDSIFLAGAQLRRRRLRAFLCALSVGVGVASMMFIAGLGTAGRREVRTRIDSLGLNGLSIYVSEPAAGRSLMEADAKTLSRSVVGVQQAMALKAKSGSYRATQSQGNAIFFGVTETLGDVMGIQVLYGTLPNAHQVQRGDRVAVVDRSFAHKLYGRENIVGKRVRFMVDDYEQYYRIIGVISDQTGALGNVVGALIPSIVYVPYRCLAGGQDSADQIMVQCMAGADPAQIGVRITRYLSDYAHVAGTLAVQDMGSALAQVEDAVSIATSLFLAVAAISFGVAMLGVLSGMLSAAHEKKAEIGLYMALGARRADVARLFVLQAVLLSVAGGFGGLLTGGSILLAASALTGVNVVAPMRFVLCVLALSGICGAAAGALPAVHAATLRPVDAMR